MSSGGVRKLLSSMWTNDAAPGAPRRRAAASCARPSSTLPAPLDDAQTTAFISSVADAPPPPPLVFAGPSHENTSRGSTPSSDSPDNATGNAPRRAPAPYPVASEFQPHSSGGGLNPSSLHAGEASNRDPTPPGGLRRNYTESSALSGFGDPASGGSSSAAETAMRRNISAVTLTELRKREQTAMAAEQQSMMQGSRAAVVEAVACKLLEHILGLDAALAAMREAMAAAAADNPSGGGGGSGSGSGGSGGAVAAATSEAQAAEDARLLTDVPPGISQQLQNYILTIVRHLELPNSCIVAALIYVERAVLGTRFSLSITNWQPCLLAAFVIAAKLSFDEPVWNEDFVKALRISNVQVCQVSRWEADFLQLLSFNTNVTVSQYAQCCFTLQRAHEHMHGRPCRFFTYLMSMAGATLGIGGAADEGASN